MAAGAAPAAHRLVCVREPGPLPVVESDVELLTRCRSGDADAWDQHALRHARLYRREGRVSDAGATLRQAVADVEQLADTLPDHALRTGFRSDKLAAHDELVDLLVARGGDGDAREACRIADTAKAQTLAELVAGTVGAPAPAGNQDPELHTLLADLNATYVALHDTAAEPSRLALVRLRADDLERRITATRLRLAAANKTVVSVGALSVSGRGLAYYSDYGKWVDLAAPGTQVVGPVPGGSFATWSGTSMAAPFTAGQAALVRAKAPALHADKVATTINGTARKFDNHKVAFGTIDILASLKSAAAHPHLSRRAGGSRLIRRRQAPRPR